MFKGTVRLSTIDVLTQGERAVFFCFVLICSFFFFGGGGGVTTSHAQSLSHV